MDALGLIGFDKSISRREALGCFAGAFAVAIAYWALARYSLSLPVQHSGISYIWPADGVALGALLCVRRRSWPLFLAAVFLGNFFASNKPVELNLVYSSFQVFESFLVATVIVLLLSVRPRLDSLLNAEKMLAGMLLAMAAATLVSNSIDWLIHRGNFWEVWSVWYVSDMLGMLVVAPLVIAARNEWRIEWGNTGPWRQVESVVVLGGMVAITYLNFASPPGRLGAFNLSLTPLLLPAVFMLWAAIRFGLLGGMLTLAILVLVAFRFTSAGMGPFAAQYGDLHRAAFHLQLSLGIGTILMLLIASRTVEWRRALAESQVSRKRLEFAIEASDMVVFETDPKTGEIEWSGDAAFVIGIPAKDLASVRAWGRRLHREDRQRAVRLHTELQQGLRPSLTLDYRLRRADGAYVTVCADAYSIPDCGVGEQKWTPPMRIIGVLRNVTDTRRIEGEKRRLEERLRQAEKLEAIGGLAGGVAHDFNNILGAILGYAEMLQDQTEPGSRARKYVDTVAAAGERGKALVAQILAFSRTADSEKHPVDMRHLVEEVVATLRGSLPPGVGLEVRLPPTPVAVLGNAVHLYQLEMNLCTNGVQAMTAGGVLRVSLALFDSPSERLLRGGVLATGRFVRLEIEDEGVGIPDSIMARVFEPFFSTKARGKGTGLGLSIAHGVALAHGGAIDIESRAGVGTRATAYLPECAGEALPADDDAREVPRGHGETVMVIDDEPHLVELAQDILAELGYEPVGYTSSGRALAAITLKPDRFDAVVSDEVMPEITGSEFCARLRAQSFLRPVILMSGYGGPGFEVRAENSGATRVLRKPYRRNELAIALAESLGSHAPAAKAT